MNQDEPAPAPGSFWMLTRRRWLGGASAVALSAGAGAARSAAMPARPVLLELFTSQGCSSCPPADAYLSDLILRPGVVGLAYHVDYWDRLGWRDPFSMPAATARQRAYATQLGSYSYTPQLVVDGAADVVGSDRQRAEALIATAQARATALPVNVVPNGSGWTVALPAAAGAAEVLVEFVTFDPRHVTPVARGENQGRTLVNSNVVRSVERLGSWHGQPAMLDVPRTADRSGALAAAILRDGSGRVIGAATLPSAAG